MKNLVRRSFFTKALSLLTAMVILFGAFAGMSVSARAQSEEQTLPVTWDLTDIFDSDEAWYEAYDDVMAEIATWDRFRGTLNTAEGIYDMISTISDSETAALISKMALYAEFKQELDNTDAAAAAMLAKFSVLQSTMSEITAYIDPEIFSMSMEEREEIFSDPMLEPYAYCLRAYTDEKTVYNSEETNIALAKVQSVYGNALETYTTLLYSEQTYPEVELSDGTVITADDSGFDTVISGDYSREDKMAVAEGYYSAPESLINTYASLLNANTEEYYTQAQLAGFDSVLDYQLWLSDVDPEIYELIKQTVHDMLPAFHEYLAGVKEYMGLDHMYYYDTISSSAVDTWSSSYTYEEACEEMYSALAILGDDYVENVRAMTEAGHIDVYPRAGKTTGGFMNSAGTGDMYPYILLNFTGSFSSLSALCHEMGHAMYGYYSETGGRTNLTDSEPSIFTHEIASTCNEFLLGMYELDRAQSDEERVYYDRSMLVEISGALIRQMMYSEFEEYIYSVVENGGSLDAQDLNEKWMELNRTYYGDAVEYPDGFETRWSAIPHFYYGFYVYKYATSCTYAAIISHRIYEGEEGALEGYRYFLTLGSSASPADLLAEAGVDPLSEDTYAELTVIFEDLVQEIGQLQDTLSGSGEPSV